MTTTPVSARWYDGPVDNAEHLMRFCVWCGRHVNDGWDLDDFGYCDDCRRTPDDTRNAYAGRPRRRLRSTTQ